MITWRWVWWNRYIGAWVCVLPVDAAEPLPEGDEEPLCA